MWWRPFDGYVVDLVLAAAELPPPGRRCRLGRPPTELRSPCSQIFTFDRPRPLPVARLGRPAWTWTLRQAGRGPPPPLVADPALLPACTMTWPAETALSRRWPRPRGRASGSSAQEAASLGGPGTERQQTGDQRTQRESHCDAVGTPDHAPCACPRRISGSKISQSNGASSAPVTGRSRCVTFAASMNTKSRAARRRRGRCLRRHGGRDHAGPPPRARPPGRPLPTAGGGHVDVQAWSPSLDGQARLAVTGQNELDQLGRRKQLPSQTASRNASSNAMPSSSCALIRSPAASGHAA